MSTVGRVVTSDTTGPGFESSHLNLSSIYSLFKKRKGINIETENGKSLEICKNYKGVVQILILFVFIRLVCVKVNSFKNFKTVKVCLRLM